MVIGYLDPWSIGNYQGPYINIWGFRVVRFQGFRVQGARYFL